MSDQQTIERHSSAWKQEGAFEVPQGGPTVEFHPQKVIAYAANGDVIAVLEPAHARELAFLIINNIQE